MFLNCLLTAENGRTDLSFSFSVAMTVSWVSCWRPAPRPWLSLERGEGGMWWNSTWSTPGRETLRPDSSRCDTQTFTTQHIHRHVYCVIASWCPQSPTMIRCQRRFQKKVDKKSRRPFFSRRPQNTGQNYNPFLLFFYLSIHQTDSTDSRCFSFFSGMSALTLALCASLSWLLVNF